MCLQTYHPQQPTIDRGYVLGTLLVLIVAVPLFVLLMFLM
jgi:hypothetical protein